MNTTVQSHLKKAQPQSQTQQAERLFCHILKISKETLFTHPEKSLKPKEIEEFESLWQRFQAGEPLAYILGIQEFYGMEFIVDRRVLIPRPETELLVETAIKCVENIKSPHILDIGTGCGAIALSLQKALPHAKIVGSDCSQEALEVAQLNAKRLNLKQVEWIESDLLKNIRYPLEKWDLIVTNLPYIGEQKFHFVEKSVMDHEPHLALFGGWDGLELYRRLFEQINCSKQKPKWLLGEFGSLQKETLEQQIQNDFPNAKIEFYKDLAGLDRIFRIKFF